MRTPALKKGSMMGCWGVDYNVWPTYAVTTYIWDSGAAHSPVPLAAIQNPADKIYIADANHPVYGDARGWLTLSACGQWICGSNVSATGKWLVPHSDGLCVGYIDGHVKWVKANKFNDDLAAGAHIPKQ